MLDQIPILSLIVFTPLLGVLALLFVPRHNGRLIQWIGIGTTFLPLLLSAWLYASFDIAKAGDQFAETLRWIHVSLNTELLERLGSVETYHVQFDYALAADGLSLPLVFLTALVASMAALASVTIKKRFKTYFILFLLLETGMLGVFLARDLFLFFLFFEITLVPMFFLIGIYGLYEREKAANKFLVYNGLGSAFMLIAFLILISTAGMTVEGSSFVYSGAYDTILKNMQDAASFANLGPELGQSFPNPFFLTEGNRTLVFFLLLIAFGIKLPIFPFHTWMLRVHTEAPPPIVMIHSGVLLKMGAYGLLKFGVFLFPSEAKQWAVLIAVLGVVNILYGAALAFVQKEFKLILAYSSVSHMGIVLLATAAMNGIGVQGAVFQMVSHGLISALMFLLVGSLYERTSSTQLSAMGGFAKSMPFMSGMLLIAGMASLGLPGLSGFVSELLAFLSLFDAMPILTAVGCLGIILAAVYVLRGVLAITFGPPKEASLGYKDARWIEAVPMIALTAFILLIGIYPAVLSEPLQTTIGGIEQWLAGADANGGG
ncbi:NADH-quinone oxidoreductase subunit M [Paenibacillus sp.]|uniref:complex I subunit 4 family protein n=1 Tax=Paenibacillus sp. TaxID=58172 RepID=UPI002D34A926|nr:NADH-quinone oxidoreductase subunit M [Paenibacillus sp.]HZG87354.1 NADH-quinone oxidoreductase subunit M [Paenibacillus sp.]